jgi:hypothetical protein
MTPQAGWQSHRGRRRNAPRGIELKLLDLQIRSSAPYFQDEDVSDSGLYFVHIWTMSILDYR